VPEIKNLTGVRAFAALSVMLLHVRYDHLADPYEPLAFVFKNQGLGVDTFFILSGFILAYVYHRDFATNLTTGATRAFLWARLARIYPVHLFTLLVVAFVLPRLGLNEWRENDNYFSLFANLLMIHGWGIVSGQSFNPAAWTISAEWFSYLCFPLIAFITRAWRPWVFILLAALCLMLVPLIIAQGVAQRIWVPKCLALFTIGFCTFRIGECLPASRFWRAGANALGALLIFMFWLDVPFFRQAWFIVLMAILILCLFKAGPVFLYSNKLSVYLGKVSYSLYMTHGITLMVMRRISGDVLPMRFEIPAMIGIAIATYHLVEEPARKFMRSLPVLPLSTLQSAE
jgi:peptidoglycan/LPS O-acetylase OafA/YrhL